MKENNPREENFTLELLQWFQENARKLPWRETSDPYHIWLSEIMLQQTRVVAVIDYYHRFLEALPTISHLADCPEDKLMKLWQGLGYYNRARNLQKAAIQIMSEHNGIFPDKYEEIRNLSGIGDYTAGAIASNVYQLPYPAVDGNVLRVVARYTENYGDIATNTMKKEVSAWVLERMPQKMTGIYNQSLMELGATVCLPNGAPLCDLCPVKKGCASKEQELWRQLPVKTAKKPRKIEYRQVYLFYYEDKIAIRQRPKKGLLANLWEFPHILREENPCEQWNLKKLSKNLENIGTATHIFSHIEWRMEGFSLQVQSTENLPENWIFVSNKELQEIYSIPSAFSFFLDTIFR